MRFLFPFSIVPKGSRIIIYGAGEVGYDFYRQSKTSGYAEVVLWVDKQYEWFRSLNLPVDYPGKIMDEEFDFVVITAEHKAVYDSICRDLRHLGVLENRIIWNEDYTVHENVVLSYEDRNIEKEMERAVQSNAGIFLNKNRLDIIIRYLFAAEILNRASDGIGEYLYIKFINAA